MRPDFSAGMPSCPSLPTISAAGRANSQGRARPSSESCAGRARPLSNKEVLGSLTSGDCDLATVYRSMHLLEEMGLVKRFDLGDGVARFKLLRPGDDGHHHHLVCTRCTSVVEVEECALAELEQRVAARNGFKAVRHRLEFFGLCPACQ